MTNTEFTRDEGAAGLVVPNSNAVKVGPGLYATGDLAVPESGLYAFNEAIPGTFSVDEGGNDD